VKLTDFGLVFITFSMGVPTNPKTGIGLLCPMENTRPTASYVAWYNKNFPSKTTYYANTGLAYEAVYLYAHALDKLVAEGTDVNDGAELMAAMKSVSFPGVTHWTTKLGAQVTAE